MSVWLIIHKGPDWHVWPLGDQADDGELNDLVMRARVAVGFPAGDDWVRDVAQTTIQVTQGEPHPTMLARATVHDRAALAAVDPTVLATYQSRCDEDIRRARVDAARQALARLTPEERAQVVGEVPPKPQGSTR